MTILVPQTYLCLKWRCQPTCSEITSLLPVRKAATGSIRETPVISRKRVDKSQGHCSVVKDAGAAINNVQDGTANPMEGRESAPRNNWSRWWEEWSISEKKETILAGSAEATMTSYCFSDSGFGLFVRLLALSHAWRTYRRIAWG